MSVKPKTNGNRIIQMNVEEIACYRMNVEEASTNQRENTSGGVFRPPP